MTDELSVQELKLSSIHVGQGGWLGSGRGGVGVVVVVMVVVVLVLGRPSLIFKKLG